MKKRTWIVILAAVCLVGILCALLFGGNGSVFTEEIEKTAAVVPEGAELKLIVFTDIHHDPAYEVDPLKETLECAGKVGKKIGADAIWCLGDLINGHNSTKEEATALIREVIAEEEKTGIPFHNLEGNHDSNIQSTWDGSGGYGPEVVMGPEELAKVIGRPGETHSARRATDYWVDFEKQGIRVICLSADYTTFTEETATWLREEALQTDLDALVLSHCPTRPEWGFNGDIIGGELIEKELKAFCDRGGTVIALIHGHDHGDMTETAEDLPWTGVAVGCARFSVPAGGATPGMTYAARNAEDATRVLFDTVCVDREKREVRLIRFGAGEDRVIHY